MPFVTMLWVVSAVLSIYPLALSMVVAFDALFGSAAFVNELLYGSGKRLSETVATDWLYSSILWLPLSLIVLTAVWSNWGRLFFYVSLLMGCAAMFSFVYWPAVTMMLSATLGFAFIMPSLTHLLR